MLVFVFLAVSALALLAVLHRFVNGREASIDPARARDGRMSVETPDTAANDALRGAGGQSVGGTLDGGSLGS